MTSIEGITSPNGPQANNSDLNNCVSLEDLSILQQNSLFSYNWKQDEKAEIDFNDELLSMQDMICYNLFKRKGKKARKYKEWKKDELREADILDKCEHRRLKKIDTSAFRFRCFYYCL